MILVTGAADRSGATIVRAFSQQGTPVRALVHNPAVATWLGGLPHVTVVSGDLNDLQHWADRPPQHQARESERAQGIRKDYK